MSTDARREAGFLLHQLQQGEILSLPQSRPMPSIGARRHELRINDANKTWRVIYRVDVIKTCKQRLRMWDAE